MVINVKGAVISGFQENILNRNLRFVLIVKAHIGINRGKKRKDNVYKHKLFILYQIYY